MLNTIVYDAICPFLFQHLQEKRHAMFAENSENFRQLDELIYSIFGRKTVPTKINSESNCEPDCAKS